MPIKSWVEENGEITYVVAEGKVSFEELLKSSNAFYRKKPTRNVLLDFSGMPPSQLTSDQVAMLARLKTRKVSPRAGGKTALVADLDCNFGVMRMYEALGKYLGLPFEVRVFRTVDQAREWLKEPQD